MPFFSKAVAFLLFWVMTSSIIITTTTTIVVASAATTIGGTNALSLVRKIKNSKKTNANKDNTCTMESFLGTSMYTNCKREEMEVEIACDTTDDTAIATNTTPTTTLCSYSEQPVPFDDVAAAVTVVGCGDHGSFDPETHLIMDQATGVCRLKFLRLTRASTCAGAAVVAGGKFGVMVEAPLNTGPGLHNHEQNEENHHKDNSGLLLRFSIDAGVTYYNTKDPTRTAPLDRSSSRRMQNTYPRPCFPPCATLLWNGKESLDPSYGENHAFQTCFKFGEEEKYCWTNAFFCSSCYFENFYACYPEGGYDTLWHSVEQDELEYPYSYHCGGPCPNVEDYKN